MTSRIRSASKKRFSSLFSRSSTPSGSNMNAASLGGGGDGPFLHLKFGVGRPPPHEHAPNEDGSGPLLFAHEIELDPAAHSRHLHETLRTDVQRAGIARWLEQNFKEDAYIYDVVHRREGDRGMFALVTKNWARSVGDPKLHLSLYVYQDHMHVATWHAYSDRSVSYSRTGEENAPPPEGSDPYSTPEALGAAAAANLPTKEQQKDQDDGRPRFDRPAALPTDSSDLEDAEEVPFKPEEVVQPLPSTARSGRSARKPQPQPLPEPEPESEAFSQEEERQSKKSSRRPPAAKPESESESDRSSDAASPSRSSSPSPSPSPPSPPPQPSKRSSRRAPHPPPPVDDAESPSSEDEAAGPAYPIGKSQPLGKSRRPRDEAEPSPLPSPKKRSERGRDRTPVSPVAQSPSPPPAVSRKGETDRTDQQQQQRERSRRRARPAAERQPEPEPSPTASSPSRSRSPSPIRDSRAERGRRAARKAASASKGEQESEKPISNVPRRDRSARRPKPPRSPSPSRSETPPIRSKASTAILAAEAKKERVHERASRSESRSPSPPVRSTKTRSKRSTRQDDSEAGTLKTEDERPPRGRNRAPVAPTAPPQLDRRPSWRSVSRNRHRRNGSDSSGDDTLVRGDLVDPHLDIPAGGEATLLTAKRRASISEHSARRPPRPRRDDSFDPEEVQQPPRPADPPKPQTATTVLGNWIKSVGTLLKSEVEPAEVGADSEAEELEARMRRKAARAERRKARAARRAARQTDASAFEGSDDTASEFDRTGRSSRPQEDEPRRSRRQTETEEPASKPARPALRERAMSFSATLDSGFKNLRESVNKIVSGADEPPDSASSSSEVDDRQRSRRRSQSHKRRENPVEESRPEHQRRRMTVEEAPSQRQSRKGLDDERRSRSERPEPTDAQRKLHERSRRREVEPKDRQDAPLPRQPEPRSKSTRSAPPAATSPSDEDDALLLQRRAKESAHVRSRSTIDEDASSLPTRSSSRAAETSSRAARQTRQQTPRVDDSCSPERPSSRRTPRSDAPSRQPAERTKDREDVAAATRGLSAAADSGTAISEIRSKYVDRNAADRERARQDYEKERRGDNSVLRSRPSSTFQSPPNPSQSGHDDLSDEPPTRRRQVGQVALDHFAPVQQVRPSAALSPSSSTASVSTASDFAQQPRRSRPSTSRPATDADHGRGNLADEEEESRFVAARGSSSTLTATPRDPSTRTTRAREREEEEEGEYIPPIPAPASAPLSTRSSLPTYDGSGPLRPRPHRAAERQQQQKQPQPSFESGASRVPDSYSLSDSNSTWDGKLRDSSSRTRTSNDRHHTSLPRDSSFSRSRRPAFDPVSASSSVADSDSDSDSDSPDQDGEATSDPDSVAFGRRRRHDQSDYRQARVGDDWDDSRGRRGPSRRFGGVADDDDGTLLRGRPRGGEEAEAGSVRPLGPRDYDSGEYDYGNRSAAAATTLSNRPPSSTSAAASASSSRTTMFAAPDPSRTTTKSRTMVSPRPPPSFRMPEHPAASEMTDRGGWRDLQSASLRPQERPPLGLGSASHAAPREQGAGSSASFDRLTAKGRESGSVQLFGRHNAPVSRRMARRLGMS